jgi:predicted metal-dependent hydrolase
MSLRPSPDSLSTPVTPSPPATGHPPFSRGYPDLEVREREGCRPTICVLPSGIVLVTAPPGTPIGPLIERNIGWIERKKRVIQEISRDRDGQEGRILLGGRFLRLERGHLCGVREEEGRIIYTTPGDLKDFLRDRLRRALLPMLGARSAQMRVGFTGLTVREQRSRWASCSPAGRISVNLRVLALPADIHEYLVVHELAHLLEPNHSRRYWRRVGEFFPDYRHAEEELKRYWILLERDSIWEVLGKIQTRTRKKPCEEGTHSPAENQ